MDSATSSDPVLRAVFLLGPIIAVSITVQAIIIVGMRLRLVFSRRRDHRFLTLWRPIMSQAIDGLPDMVPHLEKNDYYRFLKLWNHFNESLHIEATSGLKLLAEHCGINQVVNNFMRSRNLQRRLIAATALGYLNQRQSVLQLVSLVDHRSTMLSLTAARSLLKIDCAVYFPKLLSRFVQRTDWPEARVNIILNEQPAEMIVPNLIGFIQNASEDQLPRLLQFLEPFSLSDAESAIKEILETNQNPIVIATCLRILPTPPLARVRQLCRHPESFVRVQAAKALGKVAVYEDHEILIELISDRNWWVRYRAAHALADLPFVSSEKIEALRNTLKDPFSVDMLEQILAERRLN